MDSRRSFFKQVLGLGLAGASAKAMPSVSAPFAELVTSTFVPVQHAFKVEAAGVIEAGDILVWGDMAKAARRLGEAVREDQERAVLAAIGVAVAPAQPGELVPVAPTNIPTYPTPLL